MIILTKAQADSVRGINSLGAGLDPIALADGVTFVLPEAVLTDPKHIGRRSVLTALPRRAVAASEWPKQSD